jgi:hypothetical protein
MQKFGNGNGNGNWSKKKGLLYCIVYHIKWPQTENQRLQPYSQIQIEIERKQKQNVNKSYFNRELKHICYLFFLSSLLLK